MHFFVPSVSTKACDSQWFPVPASRRVSSLIGGLLLAAFHFSSGAMVARAQMTAAPIVIPATSIGSSSVPQTLQLTTTSAETISSFAVPVSQGNKQEYTLGPVTGCVVDGVTVNLAGTTCRVPVTFTPAYPGPRPVPLQVVTGTGNINFPLNAMGNGPLAVFTPGLAYTIAGKNMSNRSGTGDGGQATLAGIDVTQSAIVVDSAGNLYFIDGSCVIRKVTAATGIITTIAGAGPGNCVSLGDPAGDGGPATKAKISALQLALDSAGNLFFADARETIRRVDAATGVLTTVAGVSTSYVSSNTGDGGPAVNASLARPTGLALDAGGNIYISCGYVVRRVDAATGIISTYAGTGTQGFSGNGGPALAAQLYVPGPLAIDSAGNLLLLDYGSVRKITAVTGIISLVAGTRDVQSQSFGDGGPATGARFVAPEGLAVDSAANLYIADAGGTVRKVEAATGLINTIAGIANSNQNPTVVDGQPATSQPLAHPYGVAIDGAGALYVLDSYVIRKVTSGAGLNYPTATNVGTADTADDPLSIGLANIGNTSLTFAGGTNPVISTAWFLDNSGTCVTGSASFSLASGASCAFAVDFKPTVVGINVGSLVVTDNSLNGTAATQSVLLTGQGLGVPGPSLALSPAALLFADTQVGGASAAQAITVTNSGSAPATPLTVSITGAAANSFSQTNNCRMALAANSTCTLMVTFAPAVAGPALTAIVSVNSNDPNSPATATLTGKGLDAGMLYISPTTQLFPSTPVGSSSGLQTSTIHNTTAQAIYLSSGSLTDSTDFTQTDNCSGLVAAGGTCTVVFSSTPKSTGPLTSTYSIHNLNTPGDALSVTISGAGTGAPGATFSPQSLAFFTVVNTAAYNQTVILTNSGNAPLTVASLTLGGANPGSFSIVSQTCAATLAPGASCTLTVGFTQNTVGSYSATLTATDNATPSTQTVTLTGTMSGIASATLTPALLAFSATAGTASAPQTLTLTNTGSAALTINSIALGGANPALFTQVTTCGASLPIAASCSISVTFKPSTAGTFTATVSVMDNGAVPTQTAALSGVATATPAPQAALTPVSASFTTTTGSTSAAQVFTLINAGNAALPISSIAVAGSAFALTANTCGTSLAASASCTLSVTFTPAGVGTVTGTLTVVNLVGTQTAALTGVGNSATTPDFTVTATPAAQTSYRGRNVNYTLQLASLLAGAPFNSPIVLTAANLPAGVTASFSPGSVLPGTTQATSVMTLSIPALVGQASPHEGRSRPGIFFATLLLGLFWCKRGKRGSWITPLIAVILILAGMSFSLTGCGTGSGFSVPTATTTITVVATSGATVHTTTVSLTIQ